MNITFVAPFGLAPKGTTRWRVLPLARALAERAHAVRVLVPTWDWPYDAGRTWHEGNALVCCIPFPARLGGAAWPILLARLLAEAWRGQPDVVHVFKPIGFSGAVAWAMLCRPIAKRPRVWADADDLEAEWAADRPAWQRATVVRQERGVLARADGVTVASRALERHVAEWRSDPAVYLPNTSTLHPIHVGEVPGRVVWYTRFLDCPPHIVADIWAAVIRSAPGPAPTLHVVGVGMRGEERAFAEAVQARGLKDTVVLCGYLHGEALVAELCSACVAILPFADTPRNRYKCPARLADLTALGVPVVAHAVGECPSYILHGETGLLAAPGDVEYFARAVVQLLSDPSLRQRMRTAARTHFAACFAPEVAADRLERAYASALAARNRT